MTSELTPGPPADTDAADVPQDDRSAVVEPNVERPTPSRGRSRRRALSATVAVLVVLGGATAAALAVDGHLNGRGIAQADLDPSLDTLPGGQLATDQSRGERLHPNPTPATTPTTAPPTRTSPSTPKPGPPRSDRSRTAPKTPAPTAPGPRTSTPSNPAPHQPGPRQPGPATPAKIVDSLREPEDGAQVPASSIRASGTIDIADNYTEAWLLIAVPGAHRSYPGTAPLTVAGNGSWAQSVYVGGADDASGTGYKVHVVLLPSEGAAAFADYRRKEAEAGRIVGLTSAELTSMGARIVLTANVSRA